MKHCDKCNVNVNSTLDYCPLCFNQITGNNDEPNLYGITKDKPKEIIKSHTTRKVFILLSLAVMIICGAINYLTKTPFWSGIVGLSIIYLWIFIRHTIMSNRGVFEKIFLQVLGILAVLLMTNYVSGGGWFLDYVLPALLSGVVLTLNMMFYISKRRRNYEMSFLIMELIILIISIIFSATSICEFKTLHLITTLIAGFSITQILVMDGKNIFQEISKKLHL